MENRPTAKYISYEIPIKAGSSGNQYNFPVNMYLTGVNESPAKIYGLEVFSSADIAYSPISTGNQILTPELLRQATLTLYCYDPSKPGDAGAKGEWIKQVPLLALHRLFNTHSADQGVSSLRALLLNGLVVDFNNSYINFMQAQTWEANFSCLFGVSYSK
jgi:hypothetical protein